MTRSKADAMHDVGSDVKARVIEMLADSSQIHAYTVENEK